MATDELDGMAGLLDEASSLGVLPDAYRQLTRVLEDPNANITRIASAVRIDPVLTAGVLRLANSAALSPREPVMTVTRAAMVVGTQSLRRLALGTTVLRMFRGMPEHLLDMRSFWTHSVAVGMLCHLFAARQGLAHTEALFVAGLLHDVGTLLLCVARPRDARRVLVVTENDDLPLEAVERDLLGFAHPELGAALLTRWGLSEPQIAAVRWHHEPSSAPPPFQRHVDLVHLADVAVSAVQLGNAGERAAHRLDRAAWTRSGLGPDDVMACLDSLEGQLADLTDALLTTPDA